MSVQVPLIRRKTGRPLSFDRDVALEKAMLVFWRHGFEASSLSTLTKAMGISPPSLYTAFGDKKQLFEAAVERYMLDSEHSLDTIRDAPTARDAVRDFLEAAAERQTQRGKPPGCFLTSGAVNCSVLSQDVREKLIRRRARVQRVLRDRIRSGISAGELPGSTDAATLAGFYMSVVQGMSTQAQDGAKRERLLQIARTALQAWPV